MRKDNDLFSRKNLNKDTESSVSNICDSRDKRSSRPSCALSEHKEDPSLSMSLLDLFFASGEDRPVFRIRRIDLFSAASFCPSDHFTSAAEWQKFTRIGLGFAPDRLFWVSPPALLSAYLSRQFQLECNSAVVVGGFDKRGRPLTDKLPIDNRSPSSATGGSHDHDIAPFVHTSDQGQRILRIIFCQSKFQHLAIQIFYQSTYLRLIPISITSTVAIWPIMKHQLKAGGPKIIQSQFFANDLKNSRDIPQRKRDVTKMSIYPWGRILFFILNATVQLC